MVESKNCMPDEVEELELDLSRDQLETYRQWMESGNGSLKQELLVMTRPRA